MSCKKFEKQRLLSAGSSSTLNAFYSQLKFNGPMMIPFKLTMTKVLQTSQVTHKAIIALTRCLCVSEKQFNSLFILLHVVLGIKPRAFHTLSQYSTTELHHKLGKRKHFKAKQMSVKPWCYRHVNSGLFDSESMESCYRHIYFFCPKI